ncbi:MAG: YigZ family protein [Lactobacillaceae bacterium]|jgi:uncharacterized YigZ family protein|nr:YigZ family protein [Lactobacillaceae bacterium]
MGERYITIAQPAFSYEQVLKKSRFIVALKRVKTEDEARAFIAQVTKENQRANHNVWTYVLGRNNEVQRYSDDGEPSGTAGVPMLEVLKNNQLHDVVAVQTRYFGGIKLGAGGLIRAYAGTVAEAIAEVGLVEQVERTKLIVELEYHQFDAFKYWLAQNDLAPQDVQYAEKLSVTVPALADTVDWFIQQTLNQTKGQAVIKQDGTELFEVPFSKEITARTETRC